MAAPTTTPPNTSCSVPTRLDRVTPQMDEKQVLTAILILSAVVLTTYVGAMSLTNYISVRPVVFPIILLVYCICFSGLQWLGREVENRSHFALSVGNKNNLNTASEKKQNYSTAPSSKTDYDADDGVTV